MFHKSLKRNYFLIKDISKMHCSTVLIFPVQESSLFWASDRLTIVDSELILLGKPVTNFNRQKQPWRNLFHVFIYHFILWFYEARLVAGLLVVLGLFNSIGTLMCGVIH